MFRALTVLCLFAAVLLAPAEARAWAWGDTLTTIWKPLPNLPQLARPGDTVQVWANAPQSTTGWLATLTYGDLEIALPGAGGGWQATRQRWELGFVVPPGTPEEMYDLVLAADATPPDTSRHSVRVLPAYRTDFYFAQISDTHLPEHTFSTPGAGFSVADTSGFPDFNAVAADLNLIHPEFILHTGDLVNEGELEDWLAMYEMSRAKAALSRLRDPVFVVSGNHDIGGWDASPPPDGTARRNWWKLFGWPYLDAPPAGDPVHHQNFGFDYGNLHVVGLETYINNGSYDGFRIAHLRNLAHTVPPSPTERLSIRSIGRSPATSRYPQGWLREQGKVVGALTPRDRLCHRVHFDGLTDHSAKTMLRTGSANELHR